MQHPTDETIECGNCGEMIPLTARKCPMCGITLFEEIDIPEEALPVIPEPKPVRMAARPDNVHSSPQGSPARRPLTDDDVYDIAQPVFIVDFNIPFWSMVSLMIKIALASIPAMLILALIGGIIWAILGDTVFALFRQAMW